MASGFVALSSVTLSSHFLLISISQKKRNEEKIDATHRFNVKKCNSEYWKIFSLKIVPNVKHLPL